LEKDICKFIPKKNDSESIDILNYVYETSVKKFSETISTYRMHLITEGEGILKMSGFTKELHRGDIFFVFPNIPYVIESINSLKYIYVSYVGVRAGIIMERLAISSKSYIFSGFEFLIDMWKNGLATQNTLSDLVSEGILLYTFAALGNEIFEEKKSLGKVKSTVAAIKKYIDENYLDSELSLEKISVDLFYNKKYISHVFKSEMKIGVIEYLNTVRVQHACTLMEQGMTSVKDIAAICGFRDALYFSKIFKSKMTKTPTQHISEIGN